jgi:hypothetical protein
MYLFGHKQVQSTQCKKKGIIFLRNIFLCIFCNGALSADTCLVVGFRVGMGQAVSCHDIEATEFCLPFVSFSRLNPCIF